MGNLRASARARGGRAVRRSVSLKPALDARVQSIARQQNRSANQVIENLIETGLQAKETEKKRFFELAERLRASKDAGEIERIKSELGDMIFGE